jgi:hypothetical protein
MHIGYWCESRKERDHLEDQDVGGLTILKWILQGNGSGLLHNASTNYATACPPSRHITCCKTTRIVDLIWQGNGPIRYEETCPDFFFFTARVHTTKSTVNILAANTHCKCFLKIAEVTHFFLYAEPFVPEVCTTLCAVLYLDRFNIRLGWISRVACCILLCPAPALLGVDISPRVWRVTILAMFSNF